MTRGSEYSSTVDPRELPRHLLGWFPFLWSRVLFPHRSGEDSRPRLAALALLIILPAIFLYPSRSFHLLEPDEGRYAQIPREMLQRGDWVVPTLQGEAYLDKPPLFYWLVMVAYSVFGVTDSVARIVPALSVHLAILAVYLIGRRSVGERSAFWAALLLAVTPGFVGMARLLLLDGLLTCLVTIMLLAVFEAVRCRETPQHGQTLQRAKRLRWGWWLFGALACGLGVLTKGPIALILLLPPLWLHRWLTKTGPALTWAAWTAFAAVVVAVNAPWYVAIYLREPVFLRYFFWEHNVLRFFQPFDHLQPVWYYVPIFLGGMLPGTLLLIPFIRHLVRGDEKVVRHRTQELGFLVLAAGWCLLFFSLSGSKLPTYILPAFPLVALGLGDFIARTHWRRSGWTRAGLGTAAVALLVGVYLAVPWYAKMRSPIGRPELVVPYVADPRETVICHPRQVNSVAFYVNRDDLRNYRSKEMRELIDSLLTRPRTIILLTHRHSLQALKQALHPALQVSEAVSLRHESTGIGLADKLIGDTPWGLCDVAVIEIKELATWRAEQAKK